MLKKVQISEGKFKDLLCTKLTSTYLDDDMGETNGCGSGGVSRVLARSLLFTAGIPLVSIDLICDLHDMAYSIPDEEKSSQHKRIEDMYFEENIENTIQKHGGWHVPDWLWGFGWYKRFDRALIRKLPALFHTAVTLGGDKSYFLKV